MVPGNKIPLPVPDKTGRVFYASLMTGMNEESYAVISKKARRIDLVPMNSAHSLACTSHRLLHLQLNSCQEVYNLLTVCFHLSLEEFKKFGFRLWHFELASRHAAGCSWDSSIIHQLLGLTALSKTLRLLRYVFMFVTLEWQCLGLNWKNKAKSSLCATTKKNYKTHQFSRADNCGDGAVIFICLLTCSIRNFLSVFLSFIGCVAFRLIYTFKFLAFVWDNSLLFFGQVCSFPAAFKLSHGLRALTLLLPILLPIHCALTVLFQL